MPVKLLKVYVDIDDDCDEDAMLDDVAQEVDKWPDMGIVNAWYKADLVESDWDPDTDQPIAEEAR